MKWFLVIVLSWPGYGNRQHVNSFETEGACYKALSAAKFLPIKDTTENEWGGYMKCVPARNRHEALGATKGVYQE